LGGGDHVQFGRLFSFVTSIVPYKHCRSYRVVMIKCISYTRTYRTRRREQDYAFIPFCSARTALFPTTTIYYYYYYYYSRWPVGLVLKTSSSHGNVSDDPCTRRVRCVWCAVAADERPYAFYTRICNATQYVRVVCVCVCVYAAAAVRD